MPPKFTDGQTDGRWTTCDRISTAWASLKAELKMIIIFLICFWVSIHLKHTCIYLICPYNSLGSGMCLTICARNLAFACTILYLMPYSVPWYEYWADIMAIISNHLLSTIYNISSDISKDCQVITSTHLWKAAVISRFATNSIMGVTFLAHCLGIDWT